MQKKYIMALDLGTTSVRALIFDKHFNIVSIAQKEFTQFFPKENEVEHDPNEIFSSSYGTIIQALTQKKIKEEEIASIGITNQRETTVVWDKVTGEPIYNAIVWQDSRVYAASEELKKDKALVDKIQEKTGLIIDSYFSALKIKWILDNVKGARKNPNLMFGTIDTWILWKLTNGKSHFTDATNASRTLLYNIRDLKWDEELLKIFNIPKSILPVVKNSSDDFGVAELKLIEGIRITGVIGDQQASLFGHRTQTGSIKGTYGTGAFLMLNTGEKILKSKNGLLTTIGTMINNKPTYALEGTIYVAGSAFKWLKDGIGIIQEYDQIDHSFIKHSNTRGLVVIPFFTGVGAPFWNGEVRGSIHGINRGSKRHHIVTATAKSIAFQTKDILDLFEKEYEQKIDNMFIDGGVTNSQPLIQYMTNILNTNLHVKESSEMTSIGAIIMAGLFINFWKDDEEIDSFLKIKKTYKVIKIESDLVNDYSDWTKYRKIVLEK